MSAKLRKRIASWSALRICLEDQRRKSLTKKFRDVAKTFWRGLRRELTCSARQSAVGKRGLNGGRNRPAVIENLPLFARPTGT